MIQESGIFFQCHFLHIFLEQANQLLGFSIDVTLATNRLTQ